MNPASRRVRLAVASTDTTESQVVLCWRPGCPFCAGLKRRLRQLGVRTTEVNIWSDPDAAAAVRAVAGGNETVPAVFIGETSMVNPTASQVLEAARRLAPAAVDPDADHPRPRDRPPIPVLAAWLMVVGAVIDAQRWNAWLLGAGSLSDLPALSVCPSRRGRQGAPKHG
jgi:glutaredoxin